MVTLYVATFHQHLHMEYNIYFSVDSIFQTFICSNIPAAVAYGVKYIYLS